MKIEIELGFSHIRDSIHEIDARLAMMAPENVNRASLQHLRNALFDGLPAGMQKLVAEPLASDSTKLRDVARRALKS